MGLRIAILGASGIGKYHVREFLNAGCEITSILGFSEDSSRQTAAELKKLYSVITKPYCELNKLLMGEKIQAVSICTPLKTHYDFTKKCLEANLHVLCEKPLIGDLPVVLRTKNLLEIATQRNLVLSVNTQWTSLLPFLPTISPIKSFEMNMQPGVKGRGMLLDHLSHPLSILISLCGYNGNIRRIEFPRISEEKTTVTFLYGCKDEGIFVKCNFSFKEQRPREISFKINNVHFKRLIGENYSQKFLFNDQELVITDPFKLSIRKFIDLLNSKANSNPEGDNILSNAILQEKIISEYDKRILNS